MLASAPPLGEALEMTLPRTYRRGYIAITPMRADEHDHRLLDAWKERPADLPSWRG